MKKLMFAAAALTAGFAMADIVSSDIVGYAQKQLRTGFTMSSSTFVPVGGGDVNIQDIKPNGDSIDEGNVSIQTLDAYGRMVALYTYYGEDMYDDGYPAGWYDDDGLVDITFDAGTGLWVAAPDSATSITIPAPELN